MRLAEFTLPPTHTFSVLLPLSVSRVFLQFTRLFCLNKSSLSLSLFDFLLASDGGYVAVYSQCWDVYRRG